MKKKTVINNDLKGKQSQIFYPNNSRQDPSLDGSAGEQNHNLYIQKTYAIKTKRIDSGAEKKFAKNITIRQSQLNSDNYRSSENPEQKSISNSYMKNNFKVHQDQYLKLKNANSDKVLKTFHDAKKKYETSMKNNKDNKGNDTRNNDSQTSRTGNNNTEYTVSEMNDNKMFKNFFKVTDKGEKSNKSPNVNKLDILKNNKKHHTERDSNGKPVAADKLRSFLNKQGTAYAERMPSHFKFNRNKLDHVAQVRNNDEYDDNSNMVSSRVKTNKLNVFVKPGEFTLSNENLNNRYSRNANSLDRKNYQSSREAGIKENYGKRDLSNAQNIDSKNSQAYAKNKKKLKKIAIMNKNDVSPGNKDNTLYQSNEILYKNYDFLNSPNSIDVLKSNNMDSTDFKSDSIKNPTLPKILTNIQQSDYSNRSKNFNIKKGNNSNNNTKNDSMQKSSRPNSKQQRLNLNINEAFITKEDAGYNLIASNKKVTSFRLNSPKSNNNARENVLFKPEVFSLVSNDSSKNIYNIRTEPDEAKKTKKTKKQIVYNAENDSANNDSTNNLNLYNNKAFENTQKNNPKGATQKKVNISITPKGNLQQVNFNHITPKHGNPIDSNNNLVQGNEVNNKFLYLNGETKQSTSPPSSHFGDLSPSENNMKTVSTKQKTIYDKLDNYYTDLPKIALYYMKKLYTFWMRADITHYFADVFRNHFAANWKHIRHGYNSKVVNQSDLKEARFLKERYEKNLNNQTTKRKKILVLDLDETLVHCKAAESLNESTRSWDKKIKITMSGGGLVDVYIFYRPYLMSFQKTVNKYFEVCIFTASNPNYANPVIDTFDPNQKYIKARYYRDSCLNNEKGYWVKDLGMFKERTLKDIVIVDNSASCYISNLENAIPVVPFIDNNADNELKDQEEFQIWLSKKEDIREPLRRVFGLGKMCYCNTIEEAYEKLLYYYIK